MKPVLADSSAVLAYLRQEPAGEVVRHRLAGVVLSTVNLAEVVAVLTRRGVGPACIDTQFLAVFDRHLPFDAALAVVSGRLITTTAAAGLSLGDRACLATAAHHRLPVLTADRAWASLDIGVEIEVIR